MIRKSITTGIIVGLVLTLVLLYPTFTLIDLPYIPLLRVWGDQAGKFLHWALLMACGAATLPVFLTLGTVAAWRARATSFVPGARAGVLSGLAATGVLYVLLIAPSVAVLAGKTLFEHPLSPAQAAYPKEMVVNYARHTLTSYLDGFIFLAGAVVGAVQGGLVGWLRRDAPPPACPASLLAALSGGERGRRAWFSAYRDEAAIVGLVVGAIGGGILFFTKVTSGQSDPSMDAIFRQAMEGVPLGGLFAHAVSGGALTTLLIPLDFLVWIGIGGLAAMWVKNPFSRLGARVYAATIAGMLAGVFMAIHTMGQIHFGIGLLPQLMMPMLNAPEVQVVTWPGMDFLAKVLTVILSAAPVRLLVVSTLSTMQMRVALMYLLPLPFLGGTVLFWMLWGALQGLFYAPILMLVKRQPVDRARLVQRDILSHEDQFLQRLYRLFQTDGHAVQVLEHLAFDLKSDPPKAHVAAAFHILATQPEDAVEALDAVSQATDQHPAWKLQVEIHALHTLLLQGLRAATVAQMAAIVPMPEHQTTSLPPQLAKAGEYLSHALEKIKKVERVDDLGSKLIYLNNTLEKQRYIRTFIEDQLKGSRKKCCTLFPEFNALRLLLDRWEEIVLNTVKDLQGRAELKSELKTRNLTFAPKLTLSLVIANNGLNVAEDVRLSIENCQDHYEVVEGQKQHIDILSPQDSRELCFTIRLVGRQRRIRICWEIVYKDALNDGYRLEFGDQVEFIETEKPFQRIFPIPYVTGTPLQSSEMFVGRQDVFAFVREHLLGKYQNNVIVLHGQRRTGKTSVLYRLGDVLSDTHECVLIDMQGKAARGEVDFLYSIADDVVYALENKEIMVDMPDRKDFEESPEFFFRSRFLRSVYQALGDKNLLLMFDEFEELQKRVEDGKLTPDIFPYLRNLMQHERKVDFVFAGTHKLEELAAEYWSILFNIAAYKKITFLDPNEVTRLVTQPVESYGMEYDPLAIERIYQVTAGHPYFTQLVCHELVAYHNELQRSYMTSSDINAGLERIVERGEAHFKYIWAESSTHQRLVLLALAELLEMAEAATPEDVGHLLQRRGRPLNGQDLPQALSDLESRDILMRADPRSSLYRFRVDLIRRWIYATRPAYEKVM